MSLSKLRDAPKYFSVFISWILTLVSFKKLFVRGKQLISSFSMDSNQYISFLLKQDTLVFASKTGVVFPCNVKFISFILPKISAKYASLNTQFSSFKTVANSVVVYKKCCYLFTQFHQTCQRCSSRQPLYFSVHQQSLMVTCQAFTH